MQVSTVNCAPKLCSVSRKPACLASCVMARLEVTKNLFSSNQRRKLFELRQRKMRTAQHDHVQFFAVGVGERKAGFAQHVHGYVDGFFWLFSLKSGFECERFGCDANHVK